MSTNKDRGQSKFKRFKKNLLYFPECPSNIKKGKGKKHNALAQPETTKTNKKIKKQCCGGMNKQLDKKGKGKATANVADSELDTEMGELAFMADVDNEINEIPYSNN
ncbi:hypothetical protein VKT23_019033, partial [Stygiomarasmius scandens]